MFHLVGILYNSATTKPENRYTQVHIRNPPNNRQLYTIIDHHHHKQPSTNPLDHAPIDKHQYIA